MSDETRPAIVILVDADACPVKDEVYRVAARYSVKTFVVANQPIAVPRDPLIERVLVPAGPDVADDWIAEHAGPSSVVVTADVPLADRCLKVGAAVIGSSGRRFTTASIGADLAMRNLLSDIRAAGETTRGPKPFDRKQRSEFLQALDRAVVALRRAGYG
ncbi:YaiI/YqxD family protein [Lichenifustis flavocetrariae]|uniref:UPF0178 protein M8523_06595 n=1 Tax=Lichenifustis flavocetrariae TaxID=2949735 RepID=A0AA41YZH1_9HYPH|nr:YaiI/YqxD family protein [Lichenifustis flavocetrariae]MCW6507690.1 YaiI/YqxD family protein [Lichenifustis flavocetrariae]